MVAGRGGVVRWECDVNFSAFPKGGGEIFGGKGNRWEHEGDGSGGEASPGEAFDEIAEAESSADEVGLEVTAGGMDAFEEEVGCE